jgi:hypothetical protein
MPSWDNVGDAANIVQLTGLDATRLIALIVKAASTARMHKRNCRRFAQHLKLIGALLQQLRVSELRKYPETREPLEQLEDALRRGYLLVNSCQDRSYLYLLAMGWNIVYQFRKAQSEIDNYLRLVPLITLVDNARIRVGNQPQLLVTLAAINMMSPHTDLFNFAIRVLLTFKHLGQGYSGLDSSGKVICIFLWL